MQTYDGFQWELGKPVPWLSGKRGLCSADHYHAYTSPLQAVLMNPTQTDFDESTMRLFVADGEISREEYCKCDCHTITLRREIQVPEFPLLARIHVATELARVICKHKDFMRWAVAWLNGSDRSESAARAVCAHAIYATIAADAVDVANAAARVASAVVYAADIAVPAIAYAAAYAAARVAYAVIYVADIDSKPAKKLPNLHWLCKRAIEFEAALEIAKGAQE